MTDDVFKFCNFPGVLKNCFLSSVGNAKVELFEEGKHGNVHAALGKCLWCS